MFIYLLYFLLNMKLIFSTMIIQGSGIYEGKSDDIAIIFYLTVENSFDHEIHVSLHPVQCIESNPNGENADEMYLIGGDMGFLKSKSVQNLTILYPNLYVQARVGKCIVALDYETDETSEEMRHEIYFDTSRCSAPKDSKEHRHDPQCSTVDQDNRNGCNPVDCVIKYSSTRSFFSKEYRMCQQVPRCPPNAILHPKSNTCPKDRDIVCKRDLELIEDGYFEKCSAITNYQNFLCHNGILNNVTGNCDCDDGWITSTCHEGSYHPTLDIYHMCNIEVSSWGKTNKEKLLMTILALIIIALAIAAKMLIAVCILNWCCHFIKSKKGNEESFCEFDSCPYLPSNCGDEDCPAVTSQPKSDRNVRVSFSDAGKSTSNNDSSDDNIKIDIGSNASVVVSSCHCGKT